MYNNTNNRTPNRSFGRRDFGKSDGPRQMHKTTCSECGKECEVPFIPSGNKPVYCSNCFEKQSNNSFKPRFENRNTNAPQPHNSDQLNTIINRLDKIIALLTPCPSDSCCQKEVSQDNKPQAVKEVPAIAVEKKKKTPIKPVKAPKK